MTDLVQRAAEFAKAAHEAVNQRRKYTDQPYFVHPEEVATRIADLDFRPEMVAAAYLHDTVEDTNVTIDQIYEEFGNDVGRMVAGLTDVSIQDEHKQKNRKERKELDAEHLSMQDADTQTIKYVDIYCNTSDIAENAPGFARSKYLPEIKHCLEGMTKGDAFLRGKAWEAYYAAVDKE